MIHELEANVRLLEQVLDLFGFLKLSPEFRNRFVLRIGAAKVAIRRERERQRKEASP